MVVPLQTSLLGWELLPPNLQYPVHCVLTHLYGPAPTSRGQMPHMGPQKVSAFAFFPPSVCYLAAAERPQPASPQRDASIHRQEKDQVQCILLR